MIFHDNRKKTVLCGSHIEIVNDEQGIFSQGAKVAVVILKTLFFADTWHIICKVHLRNRLMQISSVFNIKDVSIVFFILSGICFSQFTFSNAWYAIKKYFRIGFQIFMKIFYFGFSANKMTAWSRYFAVSNIAKNNRRQGASGKKLLILCITLNKGTFHSKADDL